PYTTLFRSKRLVRDFSPMLRLRAHPGKSRRRRAQFSPSPRPKSQSLIVAPLNVSLIPPERKRSTSARFLFRTHFQYFPFGRIDYIGSFISRRDHASCAFYCWNRRLEMKFSIVTHISNRQGRRLTSRGVENFFLRRIVDVIHPGAGLN